MGDDLKGMLTEKAFVLFVICSEPKGVVNEGRVHGLAEAGRARSLETKGGNKAGTSSES
jgi:hypothetical protein